MEKGKEDQDQPVTATIKDDANNKPLKKNAEDLNV
jgi:hypothetical protein